MEETRYERLSMRIVAFSTPDVITTSDVSYSDQNDDQGGNQTDVPFTP